MTASLPSIGVATNAYHVPRRSVLGAVPVDPAIGAVAMWAGPAAAESTRSFLSATIRNPNTQRAYRRAIRGFVARCVERGIGLQQITTPDVAEHLRELAEGGLQPSSVKLHLAALKHWLDTMLVAGLLPYSPAHVVRGPRASRSIGTTPVMTADEARRLLTNIDDSTLIGARDRALLGVMLFSFARIGAVLQMLVGDYRGREGQGAVFMLHEKGGKLHRVSAHHQACEALDAYLALADLADTNALLWQGIRHGQLTGKPLTQDRACKMVKERCRAAGLSDAFGNHSLRATGITLHREAGGDLAAAQRIAGHASIRTTQAYDRSGAELGRAEVERVQL